MYPKAKAKQNLCYGTDVRVVKKGFLEEVIFLLRPSGEEGERTSQLQPVRTF